jgi:hypothetical protein
MEKWHIMERKKLMCVCVCMCVCVYLKVTIHLKREAYISPGADVYAKTGSGPPMTNFDMSSLGNPLFDMSRPLRDPRPIDGGFGLVAPTTSFASTMPQGNPSLSLSPLFRALSLTSLSLSLTHTHSLLPCSYETWFWIWLLWICRVAGRAGGVIGEINALPNSFGKKFVVDDEFWYFFVRTLIFELCTSSDTNKRSLNFLYSRLLHKCSTSDGQPAGMFPYCDPFPSSYGAQMPITTMSSRGR